MINLKQLNKRYYLIGLVVAALILIVVLIYFLVINDTSLATEYRHGKPFLLPSNSKSSGSRMQITMPAKFTALPDGSDTTQIYVQKNGQTTTRSVAVFAQLLKTTPMVAQSEALSTINRIVPSILSVTYYDKTAPSFQKLSYTDKLLDTVPEIKVQDLGIKPITALTMSFTAKANNATPAEIDGLIQYKESKGNNYIVIVSSVKNLWQADQPTWQKLVRNMTINK